jgi:hypothetical protein
MQGDIYDEKVIYEAFEDYIDLEYLEKHPLIKNDRLSHDVLKNLSEGDTTGLITHIEGQCANPECKLSLELQIWMELGLERKDGYSALFNITKLNNPTTYSLVNIK